MSPAHVRPAVVFSAVLVFLIALSLFLGRYPSAGFLPFPSLLGDNLAKNVVLNLRLPRVLAAVLLGMALGASGMVFQMIFSNPLVEPGFLGVSQGAAFGAGLAMVWMGGSRWLVQASAVCFAFSGLLISRALAHRIRYGGWVLRLVLAGISVSTFYSAGTGVLKYLADPLHQLPEITFWLLGGLWGITWGQLLTVTPVAAAALGAILSCRWRLNVLSLGDETAFSLGAWPRRERTILLGAAVAATAVMISVCGVVGWVGLIVPHLARRRFGADSRSSLPGSMLFGALFTLACDDLARVLLAGEVPLGVLTSSIGAALFLALLTAKGGRVRE